jgi:Lrp/AsnC family transcriptional regulator, leucine-responsive regulatory protein
MLIYPYVNELDEVDVAILEAVQENGRISNVELSQTINLSPPATHARVKRLTEQGFIRLPEVLECHHVTGEHDYLLKVVVRNRADLERFVVKELTPITGVARIYTSLVLTEIKSTTILPIPKT